jgi:predicted Zn-dependent peptidase
MPHRSAPRRAAAALARVRRRRRRARRAVRRAERGGAAPRAPGRRARGAALRIPHERYTLPNGLVVILARDPSAPVVAVDLWYHVGSKNELPGRTGFAHMFEHVMFTGSGHVPYGVHDRLTMGVGGSNNGSTGNDRTNYYETVPANYLETALWLEADRMGFLLDKLDSAKFAAQRDVVQNERRQGVDNVPYGRVGEIWRRSFCTTSRWAANLAESSLSSRKPMRSASSHSAVSR